jgi:hypothetical protein
MFWQMLVNSSLLGEHLVNSPRYDIIKKLVGYLGVDLKFEPNS